MVQLNLLPDVKLEYIKSRNQKRLVMLLATLVVAISLGVTILLALVVYGFQNVRLSMLDDSIKEDISTLQSTEGLNEILTIQNQLSALDKLHDDKPVVSRLFPYLAQTVPSTSVLEALTLDTAASTITISGTSDSLQEINTLVDTFKFAEISRGEEDETDRSKAFSQVVLSGFAPGQGTSTFTITMMYDPLIFSRAEKNITIVVPNTVSTRSQTEQPRALFEQNDDASSGVEQ